MTASEIISQARKILRDTGSTHYDDTLVARGIVNGYRRLCSIRPEARYRNCSLDDDIIPEIISDYSMTIDVQNKWLIGLVYAAVASCLETDVVDAVSLQLATTYQQKADAIFAS